MHIGEIMEVGEYVLLNDSGNRVRHVVDVVKVGRDKSPRPLAGKLRINDEYGPIPPVESVRVGFRKWENRPLLHFIAEEFGVASPEEDARYIFWFDSTMQGYDFHDWHGWGYPSVSYQPSLMLMKAMWRECAHGALPALPHKPNYDLVKITGSRGLVEKLRSEGLDFKLANYQRSGEVKSIDRQFSDSFIAGVQFPGSSFVWPNRTLDDTLAIVEEMHRVRDALRQGVTNSLVVQHSTIPGGSERHRKFLAELKSHCYAIKGTHGNQTSKAVFEVYKMVARYFNEVNALTE